MNKSKLSFFAALALLGFSLLLPLTLRASDYSEKFQQECTTLAAATGGKSVAGLDDWLFLRAELRHLAAGTFWGEAAEKASVATSSKDPLAAILDFKEQLDKLGIELIMLPVPPKAALYPDKLSQALTQTDESPFERVDLAHQHFFALLQEHGVKVIDLIPLMAPLRNASAGPLFCKSDTHWSGNGCVLAAAAVAAELRDRPWYAELTKTQYASESKTVAIRGDLVTEDADGAKAASEDLPLRFVGTREGPTLVPVKVERDSPILLLSDSQGLVFHIGEDLFARGAGLPDQLAFELGMPLDTISSRGDGVTKVRIDLYQRARADPAWLEKKRAIIWCFSSRDFTQGSNGWRKVPVKRK